MNHNLPADRFQSHMDASTRRGLACLAILFTILALLTLTFDLPLSTSARGKNRGGDLVHVIHLSEVFGHGAGILLIALTIYVLDPARRRRLPRLLASVFAAGLAVNLVKACVARFRPNAGPPIVDVWQTFVGWLPITRAGRWDMAWNSQIQSFPSGHTATAVALAISLSLLYPRGRWLFATFAVLAAMQRVFSGLHFPSDTLVAAALACVVARWMHGEHRMGRLFDRFECGAPAGEWQWANAPRCVACCRRTEFIPFVPAERSIRVGALVAGRNSLAPSTSAT